MKNTLNKEILIAILLRGGSAILIFLLNWLISARFGVSGVGVFAIFSTGILVITTILGRGFNESLVKYISIHQDNILLQNQIIATARSKVFTIGIIITILLFFCQLS